MKNILINLFKIFSALCLFMIFEKGLSFLVELEFNKAIATFAYLALIFGIAIAVYSDFE